MKPMGEDSKSESGKAWKGFEKQCFDCKFWEI